MGKVKHHLYGELPRGWEVKKLKDVSDPRNGVQTGPFGSQLHKADYTLVGTPIITVEHLGANRIIHTDTPLVSDEDKERLSRYSMKEGDIIFSRVGSVDRSALVRKEEDGWLFSGRCLRVRPNKDLVDPAFLSFFMSQEIFKEHVRRIAVGATMPSINTEILEEVEVLIPPLIEQRRMAHILGTLDDKIELNRRMNATLEAIARALFKSWFVDFDPVRAKAAGRPSGLPPDLDAMFPSRFIDSELGDIPEGWGVGRIGDIAQVAIGGDWGNEEQFAGAVPVRCLRGVDLDALRMRGQAEPPLRWIKATSLEKRGLSDTDVIIAASGVGPLGKSIWINERLKDLFDLPLIYSNFTKRLTAKSKSNAIFLDRLLLNMHSSMEIWEYSSGTSIPNLEVSALISDKKIILPSIELRDAYARNVLPVYHSLYSGENLTLEGLRNEILPKIIQGKI